MKDFGAMMLAIAMSTPVVGWATVQTGEMPTPGVEREERTENLDLYEYCASVGMVAQSITQAKERHSATWDQIKSMLENKVHQDAMRRIKHAFNEKWESASKARDVTRQECIFDWKNRLQY